MAGEGETAFARRAGKSEAAFRTISEVAEDLEVPQHVLRFWESRFPQIKPLKRGGGRRYYRPEDVALLRRIRDLLYGEGYTIKGVQKLLKDGAAPASARAAAPAVSQDALPLALAEASATPQAADEDEADPPAPGAPAGDKPTTPDEGQDTAGDGQDPPADAGEPDQTDDGPNDMDAPAHLDAPDSLDDPEDDVRPSALTAELRGELEDLLDELERLRRLLLP